MCYRVLHRPVNVTCAPISIIFCLLESPTATRSRPGFRPQNSHPACCGVSYRQARAEHRRRSRRTSVLDFHKGKGQDRIGKQASKQTLVAGRSNAIHERLHPARCQLADAREQPPRGGGTHGSTRGRSRRGCASRGRQPRLDRGPRCVIGDR
jgi:hypothetical protein